MSAFRWIFLTIVCLWLGGGCQRTVAPMVSIFGVAPDFLLIATACLSLFGTRRSGAVIGFFAGVVQGAIAGANLGAYVVTRALSGFCIGWLGSMDIEATPAVAFFAALAATLVGQFALMFVAPPPSFGPFLLATIGSAMYNGVLAIPLYTLLKRVLNPPSL